MPDEYDELPLTVAEQRLRTEIEDHRSEMGRLGRRRARLLADEVDRRGRGGPAQIAEELGLSLPAVNKLVHEGRQARQAQVE